MFGLHRMTLPRRARLLLLLLFAALLAMFALWARPFISLAALDAHRHALLGYRAAYPVGTAAIFAIGFVGFAALALPGAEILAIAAGAIFGLTEGTVLVSFASSIGATVAFQLSRLLFRDIVRQRFTRLWNVVSHGVETEGPFYLFALRLVPAIPFFLVDLLMGLTDLHPFTFYWVSQIGMLPATIAYVNAGSQLGQLRSMSDILAPRALLAFAVLGLLPLTARYLLGLVRRRTGGSSPRPPPAL